MRAGRLQTKSEETRTPVKVRKKRIEELLKLAGLKEESDWSFYLEALTYSKGGYSLIMARDLDEINVNSFNPEWLLAWNGNIDLQICLDYYAVITYITDYFTKDDTGTLRFLKDALKGSEADSIKEKMILVMNTFMSVRQMGEAEAYYRILPELHLKESN